MHELQTPRLILRQWRQDDLPAYTDICADPDVMAYYPSVLSSQESAAQLQRFQNDIAEQGWGFWALEYKPENKLIGFTGLQKPHYPLPVSPCTEIGWRLDKAYWGRGLACEAANASLVFAFEQLKLDAIYSFTACSNQRSEALMKRLGMHYLQTFEHPLLPEGSSLRKHVLYRIGRVEWQYHQKGQSSC